MRCTERPTHLAPTPRAAGGRCRVKRFRVPQFGQGERRGARGGLFGGRSTCADWALRDFKRDAEIGLREIADRSGMEVVVIRPPLVYGPGVKANFLEHDAVVASWCAFAVRCDW